MTFNIANSGINNTLGTSAEFMPGGSVQIGGNFTNYGEVRIDVRANIRVIGSVVNQGKFHIKNYVEEEKYKLIENAISDLRGEPKTLLEESYTYLKNGKHSKADNLFKKFVNYLTEHPELITDTVQILLQVIL